MISLLFMERSTLGEEKWTSCQSGPELQLHFPLDFIYDLTGGSCQFYSPYSVISDSI